MLLGVNALNHDASLALIDGDRIAFAAHAERYSRRKNDSFLNKELVEDMLSYGKPTEIVWYEKPLLKSLRRLYSGERPVFDRIRQHLTSVGLGNIPVSVIGHHHAHAAMGYYTSGFDNAAVIVMDAIGEWNTTTIWKGLGHSLEQVVSVNYPDSFGLFYSAFTQALGLKPNEEEYILMGMAALGKPVFSRMIMNDFFEVFDPPYISLKQNLHKGIGNYLKGKQGWDDVYVAASVQEIAERYVLGCANYAKKHLKSRNLVLVGGVALNCVANSVVRNRGIFNEIWVPPNPGDAGLALGAALARSQTKITLPHSYLGHDIRGRLDVMAAVDALQAGEIIGVAKGRAEFGPRALGNRSLIADPRGKHVKDLVNEIKKREPFRPFAPAVLEEHASDYFANVKHDQRYMQWTNECLYPEEYPAICHVDGTSRIQTVPKGDSNIRMLLEEWYYRTGCPMLLNTSLNIKGEPLVNTWADAERFRELNKVKVF